MSDTVHEPPQPAAPLPAPPPSAPVGDPPRATARERRNAWLAVAAYIAFDLLLPLVPYHVKVVHTFAEFALRKLVFWLTPTAVFMVLQLWLARSLVALRWPARVGLSVLGGAALLWLAMLGLETAGIHRASVRPLSLLLAPVVYGACLTLGLTVLGALLARIIREPNVLLPVALVAMPIDYVGAMTDIGFTNTVVKHAPEVVSRVSVHVPHVSGLPVLAMIGPGDALFIAFFFAVVQRFGMNMTGTFWWMAALLTLAMAEVLLYGFPVAALVPMGVAVIIANRSYFKLKREEKFAVLYAALILFVLVGAFYAASHQLLTRHAR